MSLGMGDAALLGGTFVFALAVIRLLEKLVDKASTTRTGKRSDPPPQQQAILTGPHPVLDADCRDRIVETHVLVSKLVESEGRQTDLLTTIDRNTARMADALERRAG